LIFIRVRDCFAVEAASFFAERKKDTAESLTPHLQILATYVLLPCEGRTLSTSSGSATTLSKREAKATL
jgi:hypothetical protein